MRVRTSPTDRSAFPRALRRLATITLLPPLAGAAQPVAARRAPATTSVAASGALTCRVDPTAELLSILVLLGGPRERLNGAGALDHAYAAEARERFGPHADHPGVRRAVSLASRGLEDFVAQVSSRVGPPPALAERDPIFPVGDGPASVTADTIRTLLEQARDFARRSDFTAFYDAHAAFYHSLCDRVLADTSLSDVVERTNAFFGIPAAAHELVLMPLVPRLGVAPPGVRAGPNVKITAYVGPGAVRDSEPSFRSGWSLTRVVLHEFAHQYVNAVVYGASPSISRSRALFAPVKSRVWRSDHVASWMGTIAETVVRACVAEMRGDAAGEDAERMELREQRSLGFAMIDSVAAALRGARKRSVRTAGRGGGWWPGAIRDVVATLDRIATSPAARELSDPPFDAGMAQALIASAPDSLLIILPTEERDSVLQDSLRAHVTRMRDRFTRRAKIVTDREALAGDYDGWTLWAIGTTDGNAWLRAHRAALPAVIDSERVVADTEFRGRGLVFVGAVPSPLDARRALLLTVGQRVDELTRGWWIVSADYAVMDGARTLTRGTYLTDGGRRRFVPTITPADTASAPGTPQR